VNKGVVQPSGARQRRRAHLRLQRPSVVLCLLILPLWSLGAHPLLHSSGQDAGATAPRADLATAEQTAATIATTIGPLRNLDQIARRLRPTQVSPRADSTARDIAIGQVETFYVARADSGYFTTTAHLALKTAHAAWYSSAPGTVTGAALARSAQTFEARTYPTNRANFGMEGRPVIDPGERITILMGRVPGVGGYYSGEDLYPRSIAPYSNQRKMIYLNSEAVTPGTSTFDATLAHEFQHMIHWHVHPRDDAWINEGAAMLAEYLNGVAGDGDASAFAQMLDTQLDAWSVNSERDIAHYGGSFLWLLYYYQHYGGQKALRLLMADAGKTGMRLFDDALRQLGTPDTSTDMFRRWVVANFLNNTVLAQGAYGYHHLAVQAALTRTMARYPARMTATVPQYATHYITLSPTVGSTAPLTLRFQGQTTVPLLSAAPSASGWQWWSNRGDVMNTTLTSAVDLRRVTKATLHYSLWYDTEQDFDYGYVEVSTDNGRTWSAQRATSTTTRDPNGASFGNGYTGRSDVAQDGGVRHWRQESVNLSVYAGTRILLRFEYITDDACNAQGIALDRLSIPEIGLSTTAATAEGWDARGWARVRNIVPERWLVQAIVERRDGTRVVQIPLQHGMQGK